MIIYVGRWDMIPMEWWRNHKMCGLYERTEKEVSAEIERQKAFYPVSEGKEDEHIGKYSPKDFEAMFNDDPLGEVRTDTYFIKIF